MWCSSGKAVGAGGIRAGEERLEGIINPTIRAVLGADGVTSNTILSAERSALMDTITEQTRLRAAALGLEVLDVQLKQTNSAQPEPRGDLQARNGRAERGSAKRPTSGRAR